MACPDTNFEHLNYLTMQAITNDLLEPVKPKRASSAFILFSNQSYKETQRSMARDGTAPPQVRSYLLIRMQASSLTHPHSPKTLPNKPAKRGSLCRRPPAARGSTKPGKIVFATSKKWKSTNRTCDCTARRSAMRASRCRPNATNATRTLPKSPVPFSCSFPTANDTPLNDKIRR